MRASSLLLSANSVYTLSTQSSELGWEEATGATEAVKSLCVILYERSIEVVTPS